MNKRQQQRLEDAVLTHLATVGENQALVGKDNLARCCPRKKDLMARFGLHNGRRIHFAIHQANGKGFLPVKRDIIHADESYTPAGNDMPDLLHTVCSTALEETPYGHTHEAIVAAVRDPGPPSLRPDDWYDTMERDRSLNAVKEAIRRLYMNHKILRVRGPVPEIKAPRGPRPSKHYLYFHPAHVPCVETGWDIDIWNWAWGSEHGREIHFHRSRGLSPRANEQQVAQWAVVQYARLYKPFIDPWEHLVMQAPLAKDHLVNLLRASQEDEDPLFIFQNDGGGGLFEEKVRINKSCSLLDGTTKFEPIEHDEDFDPDELPLVQRVFYEMERKGSNAIALGEFAKLVGWKQSMVIDMLFGDINLRPKPWRSPLDQRLIYRPNTRRNGVTYSQPFIVLEDR